MTQISSVSGRKSTSSLRDLHGPYFGESAVLGPGDVAHYRAAGADVVLIGEALVTGDPVATLESFLEAGS